MWKKQVLLFLEDKNSRFRSKIRDTSDNKILLKNLLISYSVLLFLGGFLHSIAVYSYLSVDPSLLFDFNDYWTFGVTKLLQLISPAFFIAIILIILLPINWKQKIQYDPEEKKASPNKLWWVWLKYHILHSHYPLFWPSTIKVSYQLNIM